MIIGYTVPEIRCVTDVIIFHFGLFFALIPSNSLKNENIKKKKKKRKKKKKKKKKKKDWKYHHFTQVYQKS